MTIFSPIFCSDQNCPRLLCCSRVNQKHAPAQYFLRKLLPHEVENGLGLETTRDAGSGSQSIETMQFTSQTAANNRPYYRKLHFRSFEKLMGPKNGCRYPADQTHTHTHTKTCLPRHYHHLSTVH